MFETLFGPLLARLRHVLDSAISPPSPLPPAEPGGRVTEVPRFGANPGGLTMKVYLPPHPPRPGAPLLVVLHGCGQEAARFAAASDWMTLADRLGAALLLPEQAARNNQGRCFNWFEHNDIARDTGEAASIRQMVGAAIDRLGCDRKRVFVAGLSAGGAMAAAVLAAYPEAFAAGAVVAGLPVGGASDVRSALACMAGAGEELDGPGWADRARALAPPGYAGSWPRLAIWQGLADPVVNPANAGKLQAQWATLHGRAGPPSRDTSPAPGVRRRSWLDEVEVWTIEGMAHGFPVAHASQEPFVLDAGIDATLEIARFWRLLPAA